MLYQIYIEGYSATGCEGQDVGAKFLGAVEAPTFREACDKLCSSQDFQRRYGNYNRDLCTVWGCRLFPNLSAARRDFG